jgi:hypothetical protein
MDIYEIVLDQMDRLRMFEGRCPCQMGKNLQVSKTLEILDQLSKC